MVSCKLCSNEMVDIVDRKVVRRDISLPKAAKELGVSLESYTGHYHNHVKNPLVQSISNDISPIKAGLEDKLKAAHDVLNDLLKITKDINEKLQNKSNQENTKLIMAYVALARTMISGLKEVAILEGTFTEAKDININHNEIKTDVLINIVMEEATPELQLRISKRLELLKRPELHAK